MCFLIAVIILTFREFAGEKDAWQAAKTKIQKKSRAGNSAAIPFARRLTFRPFTFGGNQNASGRQAGPEDLLGLLGHF